jgi:hypothetical protein
LGHGKQQRKRGGNVAHRILLLLANCSRLSGLAGLPRGLRLLLDRWRLGSRPPLARPELDDVGAISLWAEDHDPVLAGGGHRLSLFSLSRSR